MGIDYNTVIITDGLMVYLDAGNRRSYSGSGNTWYDLNKNNYNFSLVNGPTYTSSNGGAIVFDGSNDNANTSFTFPSDFTFDIYLKFISGSGAFPRIIGTEDIFEFSIQNDGSMHYFPGWTAIGSSVTVGQYTHLCGVKNGSSFFVYKNSSLIFSGSLTFSSTSNLYLSSRHDGSELSNTNISSFKIYNRALSATEILQNYNATKRRYGL